ncbi:MAG: hypothetical protein GF383_04975, partial [Candidatus Lokiarchaeota archaeon]|nr:hypothetical protein [Candidatus Lokiarchaeota archaeon]MBD3339222.1 hypothetical protein [Candidatus Lokiarchaeota archaeon]
MNTLLDEEAKAQRAVQIGRLHAEIGNREEEMESLQNAWRDEERIEQLKEEIENLSSRGAFSLEF